MEDIPRKKIPKVKASISVSGIAFRKIDKIKELSGANVSDIINYVLLNKGTLDALIKYYEKEKVGKKTSDEKETEKVEYQESEVAET